jgi:glyoxylase-like metal-dependent hydrolase (beta-lactamase superfamily II)
VVLKTVLLTFSPPQKIKTMQLHTINTGFFKLDGGAMFGVVPKSIWQKTNPADEHNMCAWALRCLLVEDGNRLMLIDTGIGDKQSEKFFGYYYLHHMKTMEQALRERGFHPDDITDVFLTHLHFDHCGGAIKLNSDKTGFQPAFKNATYWSNENHWQWATEPNAREKASFLKENILPIQESGQLKFIARNGRTAHEAFPGIDVFFADGHTESQMVPIITHKGKKLVFMADLLPSVGHIPLAYVMGYDTRPLLTLEDKELFMKQAVDEKYILFLEHDSVNECCTLQNTEKGVRLERVTSLAEEF